MPENALTVNHKQVSVMSRIGFFLLNISCAFPIAVPTFLILFGTQALGLKIGLISLLMALVKVFDGFTDIITGVLIDKTHTKQGKARPWLLWMCLPFALCLAAEFWIPASWGTTAKAVMLIVFYALTVSVFGTVVDIAIRSLLPRMTTSDQERSVLGAICGGASVTAVGFLMAAVFPLVGMLGFTGTFTLFGGIVFVLTLVGYFMVRELPYEVLEAATKNHGEKVSVKTILSGLAHNKYGLLSFIYALICQAAGSFIQGCGTYYAIYALGSEDWYSKMMLVGSFGSLVGIVLGALLVRKVGSRRLTPWAASWP